MHIQIVGDDSITGQARTYAEYRLFAALSHTVDTRHVKTALLVLRRPKNRRHEGVACTVTVELETGEITRRTAYGDHACLKTLPACRLADHCRGAAQSVACRGTSRVRTQCTAT